MSKGMRHESREERQAPHTLWPERMNRWLKTRFYCVECGAQDTWQEHDAGDDYYLASSIKCFTCGHVQWQMPQMEREEKG